MAHRHSIAEARSRFPALVREAESGGTVQLTRRGAPVAVLIGCREYERLVSIHEDFSKAYDAFTRRFDLRELAIDPDGVFGSLRSGTGGRDVAL